MTGCPNIDDVDCCGCENIELLFYVNDPNNPPPIEVYFLASSGFCSNKEPDFFSYFLSNTPPKTGACYCLFKLANKLPPVDCCGWVLPNNEDGCLVY